MACVLDCYDLVSNKPSVNNYPLMISVAVTYHNTYCTHNNHHTRLIIHYGITIINTVLHVSWFGADTPIVHYKSLSQIMKVRS